MRLRIDKFGHGVQLRSVIGFNRLDLIGVSIVYISGFDQMVEKIKIINLGALEVAERIAGACNPIGIKTHQLLLATRNLKHVPRSP